MPRPTKLNAARSAQIVAKIELGNYLEIAAQSSGVDYGTFRRWMQRGELEESGLYRKFRDAVEQACAVAEAKLVELWNKAAVTDWKAAKELLERRHPDRWRLKQALELTGANGGPIEHTDLSRLSDAQLTQFEALLAIAATQPAASPGGEG